MTLTLRSTPNLSVPASQNTAPVLEFRCLYTHDLRRKSKRWQDGILRFHTFNKRVMVYDDTRNFIGDTHWRDQGAVEDGYELELEKGVLVQVGEAVGSMEQDLTELFEKRKTHHEATPARVVTLPGPTPSTRGPPAAPLTQLRPKSLNALLGTPRGPQGRAILPTRSPFEQRHEASKRDDGEEDRPLKRQKLSPPSPGEETQLSPSRTKARANQQNRKTSTITMTDTVVPTPRQNGQKKFSIIEVESSDDEALVQLHNPAQKPPKPPSNATKIPKRPSPAPLFCSSSLLVSTTNHLPPLEPITLVPPQISQHPEEPTETRALLPSASIEDMPPINPLRLASRKPRKKLMYRDLLPSKPPLIPNELDSAKEKPLNAHSEALKRPPAPQIPPDELSTFQKAQQQRLKARMSRQNKPFNPQPSEETQTPYDDDRTCFRDQPDDPPPPLRRRRPKAPAPEPPPHAPHHTANTDDTPNEPPQNALTTNNVYGFTRKTTIKPKPTYSRDLTTLDRDLLSPSFTNRVLRRSHSAPDKAVPLAPPQIPPPLSNTDPLPHDIMQKVPAHPQRRKSPLKKSISLPAPPPARTTATKEVEKVVREVVVAPVVDMYMGPWSREAFDLFDWRPPD